MGSHAFALPAALEVGSNPDAPGVVATATGAAIGITLLLALNFALRHVLTAVHEGGHVLAAVLFGAGVAEVRIEKSPDGKGGTTSTGATLPRGPLSYLDWVVTAAMGYIAAPLFGLVAADLLGHGHASAVLWTSAVAFGLLGLMMKNWRGRFTAFGAAFVFFLLARRAEPFFAVVAACAWVWMLITGGLQQLFEDWWGASDFGKLQGRTLIPDVVWVLAYAWFTIVIAILAGLVLVGAREPYL